MTERPADLRANKAPDAAVVATIEAQKPFDFECEDGADWCKVTLASGESGWLEQSRIRLHFTQKDLPKPDTDKSNLSEIEQFARGRGVTYAGVTARAARGDAKALKQFFSIAQDADGAAGESIGGDPNIVFHLLGDEKLAKLLRVQALSFRMMVRNRIANEGLVGNPVKYLRTHFPETVKVLYQREMIDWVSPDGRYAIRKVFSDEFELGGSKVVKAEIIEKSSGRVLGDLTADDIGTGAEREGEALWSPDSKRLACVSKDLTEQRGNLFSNPRPAPLRKQTAVYQLSGDSFTKVDLSLTEPPGRKEDKELEGAILGHEYTEPVRWEKATVLLLERHEYYETMKPILADDSKFESIRPFDRLYRITVTIGPDGKASVSWKLRTDRE